MMNSKKGDRVVRMSDGHKDQPEVGTVLRIKWGLVTVKWAKNSIGLYDKSKLCHN